MKIFKRNFLFCTVGVLTVAALFEIGVVEAKLIVHPENRYWFMDDQTGKVYDWSLITFRFNQGVCSSINFQLSKRPVQLSETDQQPL